MHGVQVTMGVTPGTQLTLRMFMQITQLFDKAHEDQNPGAKA